MQQGRQADYAAVTLQLAVKALSIATDAVPHRAPQGEKRWPLTNLLPAARVLLGDVRDGDADVLRDAAAELCRTLADPSGKVTDGFGHSRPVYAWFAIHLLSTAASPVKDDGVSGNAWEANDLLWRRYQHESEVDLRLAIWCRLMAKQHGIEDADEFPPAMLDALCRLSPSTDAAPLVPLGLNDLIDSWTYYELVGLHGLHLCSVIEQDDSLAQHVRSAAEYHLGHTQPDYTTYQPWGLAAFASNPQTAVFAEQQLHDVATHLSIEGPGGAVMPALLLADAAATMAGRLRSAWAQP